MEKLLLTQESELVDELKRENEMLRKYINVDYAELLSRLETEVERLKENKNRNCHRSRRKGSQVQLANIRRSGYVRLKYQ